MGKGSAKLWISEPRPEPSAGREVPGGPAPEAVECLPRGDTGSTTQD